MQDRGVTDKRKLSWRALAGFFVDLLSTVKPMSLNAESYPFAENIVSDAVPNHCA